MNSISGHSRPVLNLFFVLCLWKKVCFGPMELAQLVRLHISSPVSSSNNTLVIMCTFLLCVLFCFFVLSRHISKTLESGQTRFEKRAAIFLQTQRNCRINRNLCGSCFLGLRPFCASCVSEVSGEATRHEIDFFF